MVGPTKYFFNAGEIATEITSLNPSLFRDGKSFRRYLGTEHHSVANLVTELFSVSNLATDNNSVAKFSDGIKISVANFFATSKIVTEFFHRYSVANMPKVTE